MIMKSNLSHRRISEISAHSINTVLKVLKASVVIIALTVSSLQAALVTYPAPNRFPKNSTHSVQVREPGGIWQDMFVYNVMVICKPNNPDISDVWNIPTSMVNFLL